MTGCHSRKMLLPIVGATIAVALAWVIHMLFDLLWKAAAALSGR